MHRFRYLVRPFIAQSPTPHVGRVPPKKSCAVSPNGCFVLWSAASFFSSGPNSPFGIPAGSITGLLCTKGKSVVSCSRSCVFRVRVPTSARSFEPFFLQFSYPSALPSPHERHPPLFECRLSFSGPFSESFIDPICLKFFRAFVLGDYVVPGGNPAFPM